MSALEAVTCMNVMCFLSASVHLSVRC